MQSGVAQAIGDLIKSGKADTEEVSTTVPGFPPLDDIYPIFKKYFNAQTQQVMDVKATSLVHQYNVEVLHSGLCRLLHRLKLRSCRDYEDGLYFRRMDLVHYCVSRSDKSTLPKAIEKVIAAINDLGSRGYISATMIQLGVMALAQHKPDFEPEYLVLSYVALNQNGHDYVEKYMPKMFIKEGSMPERFEDQ